MGGMPRDINDISNVPYNTINISSFPADPTRRGYRFDGWFTDVNFSDEFIHGTTQVRTMTADTLVLQLFAKWDFDNSLAIGNTAPGTGQIVFYVAPGELNYFLAFGTATDTSGTALYYLEAAPSDANILHSWSAASVNVSDTGPELGTGRRNTLRILRDDPNASAANTARAVLLNLNDWYLPSIDELELLYQQAALLGITGLSWSSSQVDIGFARFWSLDHGSTGTIKGGAVPVHAIRAF